MKPVKRPYLKSVLLTLLILFFPIASGATVTILNIKGDQIKLIQGFAFVLAGFIGCLIGKNLTSSLDNVGLKKVEIRFYKEYLWFIPIIFIELIILFFGLRDGLKPSSLLVYIFFTVAVGFAEELYFRGLIPKVLEEKGVVLSIILSSFLFSIGHFFNLLAGASLMDTIFQVLLAFSFGLLAIIIRKSTNSLVIPIIWHSIHNFISIITRENDGRLNIFVGSIQFFVFLIYAWHLWNKKIRGNYEKV